MPQQADTGPVEVGYFQYMAIFNGISFHFFPEIAHHGLYRNLEGIIWTPWRVCVPIWTPPRPPPTDGAKNGHYLVWKVLLRELLGHF